MMKILLILGIIVSVTLVNTNASGADFKQDTSQKVLFSGTADEAFGCTAVLIHGWQRFAINGGNQDELRSKINGWYTLKKMVVSVGADDNMKRFYDWAGSDLINRDNFHEWFNYCYNRSPKLSIITTIP